MSRTMAVIKREFTETVQSRSFLIGTVLGLITARQLMSSSEAFGDTELAFTMPWSAALVVL